MVKKKDNKNTQPPYDSGDRLQEETVNKHTVKASKGRRIKEAKKDEWIIEPKTEKNHIYQGIDKIIQSSKCQVTY